MPRLRCLDCGARFEHDGPDVLGHAVVVHYEEGCARRPRVRSVAPATRPPVAVE